MTGCSVDLRGHYLNRFDQEKRDGEVTLDAILEVLEPLRELASTL